MQCALFILSSLQELVTVVPQYVVLVTSSAEIDNILGLVLVNSWKCNEAMYAGAMFAIFSSLESTSAKLISFHTKLCSKTCGRPGKISGVGTWGPVAPSML